MPKKEPIEEEIDQDAKNLVYSLLKFVGHSSGEIRKDFLNELVTMPELDKIVLSYFVGGRYKALTIDHNLPNTYSVPFELTSQDEKIRGVLTLYYNSRGSICDLIGKQLKPDCRPDSISIRLKQAGGEYEYILNRENGFYQVTKRDSFTKEETGCTNFREIIKVHKFLMMEFKEG